MTPLCPPLYPPKTESASISGSKSRRGGTSMPTAEEVSDGGIEPREGLRR